MPIRRRPPSNETLQSDISFTPESAEAVKSIVYALRRDERKLRKIEKREKVRQRRKRAGVAGLIGLNLSLGIPAQYIVHDINEGKAEVADSHTEIHEIYHTDEPGKRLVATFVATGFNTRDPSETARRLTESHGLIGNVEAVEYSNNEIDTNEITASVVEYCQENGIKFLIFDGYSAGGNILLEVAAKIADEHQDLTVVAVSMGSSPIGADSLTDQSESHAKILANIISVWPDIVYSKDARMAAEVLGRNNEYYQGGLSVDTHMLGNAIETVQREKIENEQAPSGSLALSQYRFSINRGVERNVHRLSETDEGKPKPLFIYNRAMHDYDDRVVNIRTSGNHAEEYAEKYGLPFKMVIIDGAGHANPADRKELYNNAFTQNIIPDVTKILQGIDEYMIDVSPHLTRNPSDVFKDGKKLPGPISPP